MAESEGWSYLDSDNLEEFAGRTAEEGWASHNDDGSGSFYGEDGSWGYRNADGSGSYYGDGDDWGHWDSDNGKTYYGDPDADLDDYFDSDDCSDSSAEDLGVADIAAAVIGAGLFAAAVNRNKRKGKEEELNRVREEEEQKRQERAAKRAEWRKSPACKAILVSSVTALIILTMVLLISSLKAVGRSSSEMIGSEHGEVAEQLVSAGFWVVEQVEISDLAPSQADQDGLVPSVKIGPFDRFSADFRMPCFIKPEISYHTLASLNPPLSSEDVKGMDYREVVSAFERAGYLNVVAEPRKDVVIGLPNNDGEVFEIRIGDAGTFTLEDQFKPNLTVTAAYHSRLFG